MAHLESTMKLELTASGTWLAHGEYLNIEYIAGGSSRSQTLAKAAELQQDIFNRLLTPSTDVFIEEQQ